MKTTKEAVDHHNAVVRRAHKRVASLEPKLAAVLEPILHSAGNEAAAKFQRFATDHLTAAAERPVSDSQPLLASAPGVTSLSTMVAVKPRRSEADRIAREQDGALPAEELHVTLAFLGEVEGDLAPVAEALRLVAARHAPMEGVVAGVGSFMGGDNGAPVLAIPSVPGLVELRVDVTDALSHAGVSYSRDYGYVPHMTVAYQDDPEHDRTMLGEPLHFDDLLLVRGDVEVIAMPLIGSRPLTAAADAPPPPWSAPAADEIVDVDKIVSQLRTKSDPVRRAMIETTMKSTLGAHNIDWDVTNPFTAKVLAHSGEQITAIAKTTQLNVNRIISRSYDQGLSIPDTASAIREGMAAAAGTRATLIARTEMVGAVNGGSLAATQIVSDETGLSFNKEWLTAPGALNPRHETYEGLNGQTAPLDGFFDVGGDELQFPGDPAGSPEEVCNCRCTIVYTEAGSGDVVEDGDAESGGGYSADDLASEVAADSGDEGSEVAASDTEDVASPDVKEYVPTGEEVSALNAYTGNAYESINYALRNDAPMDEFQHRIVSRLDGLFEKSTPYFNVDAKVYRAIHNSAPEIFGTEDPTTLIGKTVLDKGYISSSLEPFDMEEWTTSNSAAMTIDVPYGSKALYLNDIKGTKIAEEEEVLLPRNTLLKITDAKKDEFGVWEIRARVVPRDEMPPDASPKVLRGVKVSDDPYVASLQQERYTTTNKINGLLAKEKRGTMTDADRGRLEALRKRQQDIRDIIADGAGDPAAEKYRVQNQINYMKRLVRGGNATVETRVRLQILEERRDEITKLLKTGTAKDVAKDAKTLQRDAHKAARDTREAQKAKQTVEVAQTVSERAAELNPRSATSLSQHIREAGGGDVDLAPHDIYVGSSTYKMGPSVAWEHDGVVVKCEVQAVNRFGSLTKEGVDDLRRKINAQIDSTPPELQGRLKLVSIARGYSPDDAYWQKRYKGFSHAAAQGGKEEMWFWQSGSGIDYSFDHEMGHVSGWNGGGPRFDDDWERAQFSDSQSNAKKYDAGSGFASSGRHFQIAAYGITSYGENAIAEDWAESIRLWSIDRRNGSIGMAAKDGVPVKVRFKDVFPARAKLIDRWLAPPP